MKRISGILLVATLFIVACSKDDDGGSINPNNFDRQGMLANWADNIIVPAFSNFKTSTQNLEEKTTAFTSDPTEANLADLRGAFKNAYLDFQTVSIFEAGKAMELNFRHFLNTYPADAAAIEANISGDYDLTSVNTYDQQGFPALDFMINGLGETDAEIAAKYASEDYKTYLNDLVARINSLTAEVNTSWQGDFRDQFVNNTSSSSTGSIDKFTNDYIMYFEKFIRSGKIGFPAGAFTGTPSPENVEAYYSDDFSRALYIKALESTQDFFNGKHFGSSETGKSYKQYINYMQPAMENENLAAEINDQFDAILSQAENLNESLKAQVENDNSEMITAFDELQKAVVLLKVDMIQVLYIGVDYVDSDGD